jgi:hypothetical protein
MPKATTPILDPRTESEFINNMLALLRRQSIGASGPQLAVIAHYQSSIEERRSKLIKLLSKSHRARRGSGRSLVAAR